MGSEAKTIEAIRCTKCIVAPCGWFGSLSLQNRLSWTKISTCWWQPRHHWAQSGNHHQSTAACPLLTLSVSCAVITKQFHTCKVGLRLQACGSSSEASTRRRMDISTWQQRKPACEQCRWPVRWHMQGHMQASLANNCLHNLQLGQLRA